MTPAFAEALATTDFTHRATFTNRETVIYRLKGGTGHVELPASEWRRLGESFQAQMIPVRKRTRRASIALLPMIFAFAMTIAQVLPYAGLIVLGGLLLGPLAIRLLHSAEVQRISRQIEADLTTFPVYRGTIPNTAREPRWFQIAFLICVGPFLLIGIIGEIGGPGTFRNTPLSGRDIGPFELIGLALIAIRLFNSRKARQAD